MEPGYCQRPASPQDESELSIEFLLLRYVEALNGQGSLPPGKIRRQIIDKFKKTKGENSTPIGDMSVKIKADTSQFINQLEKAQEKARELRELMEDI